MSTAHEIYRLRTADATRKAGINFETQHPRDPATGRWIDDPAPPSRKWPTGPKIPPVRKYPLSEVLAMESRDWPGTVASGLHLKRTDPRYPALLASMRQHGQLAPVSIYPGMSVGGHMVTKGLHRLAAAQQLGWKHIYGYDFTAPRRKT